MPRRTRNPFVLLWTVAALAASLAAGSAAPARAQMTDLTLIAPAAPGGGWDQTVRAMRDALEEAGLARGVQVQNIAGAGGTVGLAQFVTGFRANPRALMVSGLVMLGAVETTRAPVTLDEVTPIARLTGEHEVIVVPAQSGIRTLDELLERFRADPGSVSWAGGSAGGADHIMVALLARAVGVDPRRINYIPFSGGGEALAALFGNHVTAGVSGWGEFAAPVRAGRLRALAVSAPKRVPGLDVPTLREQAVNLELTNWRGVVAPPGITPEARRELADAVARMARSPAWRTQVEDRGWLDLYQGADDFAAFLKVDRARVEAVLRDVGLIP